jgi:hypothetical protein
VTYLPPGNGRRDHAHQTVGLLHPIGKKALPLLHEAGVEWPAGWRVRQDHVRRGMVVEVPAAADHAQVLEWALAAGTALCVERMTGTWRADVHLPRDGSPV